MTAPSPYWKVWRDGFVLPICPVHFVYMEFVGEWAYCYDCESAWRLDAAPFVTHPDDIEPERTGDVE